MILTELSELSRHMEWADAWIWRTALRIEEARHDERMRRLLHHAHAVQWVYLRLWRDEPVDVAELEAFPDLPSIHRWGRDYHLEFGRFAQTVDRDELGREIVVPWAEELRERHEDVHPTSLRQSMLQVALHSTYHRGQINTRIRELGGEPPLTDFVAWIWAGQPEAEWPEAQVG